MKIAIDFDGTYSSDPVLFLTFAVLAVSRFHDVRIVTARKDDAKNSDIKKAAKKCGLKVIFTGGKKKIAHCKKIGWEPNVWIDNNPKAIV